MEFTTPTFALRVEHGAPILGVRADEYLVLVIRKEG
jgi:hypothetical protein